MLAKFDDLHNWVRTDKNGVYPNWGTWYFSKIYAAIRADEPDNSLSRQIYKWLSTPKAKDIIDESGYISMR
ncbi:MAG: hypothetical protein II424_03810 [Bacteroidales bacterium]|nr:hypothetical protein [Bacteroidales bacterium]